MMLSVYMVIILSCKTSHFPMLVSFHTIISGVFDFHCYSPQALKSAHAIIFGHGSPLCCVSVAEYSATFPDHAS
jgi:hypothetical protein